MGEPTSTGPLSPARWAGGGALSGVLGALLFGGLLWMTSPDILTTAIPAIYGMGPSTAAGWALHSLHGLGLGVVFGFVVSREAVFEMLTGAVETDILDALGNGVRFALAGVVFGIAVWTLLPFVGLTMLGALGPVDPAFPGAAVEMFVGHVLFGLFVGAFFSVVVPGVEEATGTEALAESAGE